MFTHRHPTPAPAFMRADKAQRRMARARHLAVNTLLPLLLCALLCAASALAVRMVQQVLNLSPTPVHIRGAAVAAGRGKGGGEGLLPLAENSAQATDSGVCLLQNPELPNGCEATSLAMALRHWGFEADKLDIAYNYIPREDFATGDAGNFGPDPATAYAGDPGSNFGFYCLAGPVVAGANRYLEQAGGQLVAQDLSGATQAQLEAELDEGRPVIFWMTLDAGPAAYAPTFCWTLPDGSVYRPFSNLHCVLLAGYDAETYTLCDPLVGETRVPRQAAFDSYLALGAQAIVIREK